MFVDMRVISSNQRRRLRFVLGFAVLLLLLVFARRLEVPFNILIRGPAISLWQSEHLRLSQTRDGFDITFTKYPSEPPAVLNQNLPVPPVIHHIFLGPNDWAHHRNGTLAACRKSCMEMHPGYEFKFWDDSNAEEFVRDKFPEVLQMWKSYRHLIQKADSLRYMVLHEYGGIFLDLDLQCLRPLEPLREFNFVAVAANPIGISNGFIMAVPKHPFLLHVIRSLPRYNLNWFSVPYATVMFSTGCHFLSTIHALFSPRDDLRILWGPNHLHWLSGSVTTPIFRHLGLSSWHAKDGVLLQRLRKDRMLMMPLWVFIIACFTSTMTFTILGWIKLMKWRARERERQKSFA